ncbi:hypothetical protein FXF51_02060 [Nonomuraea sp. PA05]|nr:hypothetical protein FXF51_02060 [Nonomuraea sp. PA05]
MRLDLHVTPEQLAGEIGRAAAKGLYLACEHVLTTASPRVPYQSGDLERSGDPTSRPGSIAVDNGKLEGMIGYDTPYAVAQHEELDWDHPLRGEPKWLELTLYEEMATVRRIVATQIRRALRS